MWNNLLLLAALLPLLSGREQQDVSGVPDNEITAIDTDALQFAHIKISVLSHRVFRFAFNPRLFLWENGNPGGGPDRPTYRYRPIGKNAVASLPSWIKYKYSERHKAGFLYGVPPELDEVLEIDVVAYNLLTYESGLLRLTINVSHSEEEQAAFAVKLKIDNLNLEDIFDLHRLKNLMSLFKDRLWTESDQDLHLTFVASALDVGYRRPLMPSPKDGVVLHLGSSANFSSDLLDLDRETSPLRKFEPACPRDFKRTSVERHFRAKGFGMDWCEFRLLTLREDGVYRQLGEEDPPPPPPSKKKYFFSKGVSGNFASLNISSLLANGPKEDPLPSRDFAADYALILGISASVFVALASLALLAFCASATGRGEWVGFHESLFLVLKDCVTCCSVTSANDEKTKELALAQYEVSARQSRASSVQRQTDTLRRLAQQQRDVTINLKQQGQQQDTSLNMLGMSYDASPADPVRIIRNLNYAEDGHDVDVEDDDEVDEFAIGGPVILLSDDGSDEATRGSVSPTALQQEQQQRPPQAGFEPDPLGSLARPVPPPYFERWLDHYEKDGNVERAYLV